MKRQIFFEPHDTELGIWVAADLVQQGDSVIDLGCGSGAAAAAIGRLGAARVHGIDVSLDSIQWARQHYERHDPDCQITFELGDFEQLPTASLPTGCLVEAQADVVTSNPAYVPLHPAVGRNRRSIDGGPDGLKFAAAIVGHAASLGARLGFTIGSYSSPRRAVAMMSAAGYYVSAITLAALPVGDYTLRNIDQVLQLERQGEAVLWRHSGERLHYFIVGLACIPGANGQSADYIFELLRQAACSTTPELEGINGSGADKPDLAVRVLVLPTTGIRQHW
jgi:release factor glutamine methyltransferase